MLELANGSAGAGAVGSKIARPPLNDPQPNATIEIPADWTKLCKENPAQAKQEQLRVRREFQAAFAAGLISAGFERSDQQPRYLLYEKTAINE